MCPIRRNSLLVHVAYPQILGTNGLVVVVVCSPSEVYESTISLCIEVTEILIQFLLTLYVCHHSFFKKK